MAGRAPAHGNRSHRDATLAKRLASIAGGSFVGHLVCHTKWLTSALQVITTAG
jgi:hypothetical protein